MTQVDFHHDAPDKLRHACTLVAQWHRDGRPVWIHCPDDGLAARIDQMLWTFDPQSFIAHARDGHPLAAASPVRIGSDVSAASAEALLLNLSPQVPDDFTQRAHIVEIVSQDPADRDAARARFMQYRQNGCDMHTQHATTENA
jgi:DNA polymerase III subunit chi